MKIFYFVALFVLVPSMQGCSPEVGSKAWCKKMGNTPEVEWTLKDAGAFAESCEMSDLFGK